MAIVLHRRVISNKRSALVEGMQRCKTRPGVFLFFLFIVGMPRHYSSTSTLFRAGKVSVYFYSDIRNQAYTAMLTSSCE